MPLKQTSSFLFQQNKANQSFDIKIDDVCLTQIDSAKNLGVIFAASLTWGSHMNEYVSDCQKLWCLN